MRRIRISWILLGTHLVYGCASWQGQVAFPNTRFAALPRLEPAAIPRENTGDDAVLLINHGVIEKPNLGAYMPVLGQVVLGYKNLNIRWQDRDLFDWQDPKKFVTSTPFFTNLTEDSFISAWVSQGSATLSNSVGLKISAGDNGIPLGGGKAIDLKLGVDSTLKLSQYRIATLNLANIEYIQSLADIASDDDVYFVDKALVCDVNANNLTGFNLSYANPETPGFNPTVKADYESRYSGIGLILAVSFNRLTAAGSVSFNILNQDGDTNTSDTLADIKNSPPELQEKFGKVKTELSKIGIGNPDIILQSPFTTFASSSGDIVLNPINPFFSSGTEYISVNNSIATENTRQVIINSVGEHEIQYIVSTSNKLYALRTTVIVAQGTSGKTITENRNNRKVVYLKWQALNLNNIPSRL